MAFDDFGEGVTWQASVQLRWEVRGKTEEQVLQQLWISSTGQRVWRDVPTVVENNKIK